MELALVDCERCGASGQPGVMKRPHGHGWWCPACRAEYEHYRRTNKRWITRRLGFPAINPGLFAMAILAAVGASGMLDIALVIYLIIALVPISVVVARYRRRRFLLEEPRLAPATLNGSSALELGPGPPPPPKPPVAAPRVRPRIDRD